MNQYGFEFSQAGTDVTVAPDYQKIIDSSFPYLEYEPYDIDVNLTNTAWTVVLNHKKGFLPGYFYKDLRPVISNSDEIPYVAADSENIYMRSTTFMPTLRIQAKIKLTNLDITKAFTAPIESISNAREYDETAIGVKFLNDDAPKDIDSTNFRNYSTHTKMKSFSVHQTGTDEGNFGNGYILTIRHMLGYHPIFMLARINKDGDDVLPSYPASRMIAPLSNYGGKMRSTKTEIEISGIMSAFEGEYAYLVLKDPIASIG